MSYSFIEVGAKARRTWREYNYYAATCKGYGSIPYTEKSEIVTICSAVMREKESKKFCSLGEMDYYWFNADEYEILVQDDSGEQFWTEIESLSIFAEISDLSYENLMALRTEITVGSLYLSDYENSFGVDENFLCALCDDYNEYLYEKFGEEAREHDTPEEFASFAA